MPCISMFATIFGAPSRTVCSGTVLSRMSSHPVDVDAPGEWPTSFFVSPDVISPFLMGYNVDFSMKGTNYRVDLKLKDHKPTTPVLSLQALKTCYIHSSLNAITNSPYVRTLLMEKLEATGFDSLDGVDDDIAQVILHISDVMSASVIESSPSVDMSQNYALFRSELNWAGARDFLLYSILHMTSTPATRQPPYVDRMFEVVYALVSRSYTDLSASLLENKGSAMDPTGVYGMLAEAESGNAHNVLSSILGMEAVDDSSFVQSLLRGNDPTVYLLPAHMAVRMGDRMVMLEFLPDKAFDDIAKDGFDAGGLLSSRNHVVAYSTSPEENLVVDSNHLYPIPLDEYAAEHGGSPGYRSRLMVGDIVKGAQKGGLRRPGKPVSLQTGREKTVKEKMLICECIMYAMILDGMSKGADERTVARDVSDLLRSKMQPVAKAQAAGGATSWSLSNAALFCMTVAMAFLQSA